jgi:hypothetical protein
VAKTLESKPTLVQISSAWNSREGAPLGRNHYVELEVKKAKANGTASKLPGAQKPCEKMAEAIVMDGGKRGQTIKVCADPNCPVHHPNTPGDTVSGQDAWVRTLFSAETVLSAKHSVVHDYQTHRTPRMSLRFQHANLWSSVEGNF